MAYLIIALISVVLNLIPAIGQLASVIIAPALSLGLIATFLAVSNGQKAEIRTTFSRFNQLLPSLLLTILIAVFTWLWPLLFVIPGIIKSLSYSMAFYILAENPEMTAREALNKSKAIMHGHKMELFVLYLSFIPWMLLMSITAGIAGIYVIPYMTLTMTNFYHNIKRTAPVVEEA